MSRRRVAFVITELDDGGAERALVRIATGLDRSRWLVTVFCLSTRGPLAEPLEHAGIRVVCLDLPATESGALSKMWRAWRAVRRLTDAFAELKPDVIQTFLFHANIIGRLAANAARISTVLSGIRVAERRSRWRLTIDRATQHSVVKHVCVSEAVAKFSREQSGLDPQKLVVIPNGVDFPTFQSALPLDWSTLSLPHDADVVLSVGRLEDQKDPRSLLAAFAQIAAEFPTTHLVFVGEGHLKDELIGQAALLKLEQRVHALGRRRDVAALLKSSRLFVLTSQWEGMPNVLLEAAAAGIPIIATNVEGVRELIPNDDFGLVVEPGSASLIAQAMRSTLTDFEAAHSRAIKLQTRIESYSWPSVVQQYDALFASVIEAQTSPVPQTID